MKHWSWNITVSQTILMHTWTNGSGMRMLVDEELMSLPPVSFPTALLDWSETSLAWAWLDPACCDGRVELDNCLLMLRHFIGTGRGTWEFRELELYHWLICRVSVVLAFHQKAARRSSFTSQAEELSHEETACFMQQIFLCTCSSGVPACISP